MTPEELINIANQELIEIEPTVQIEELNLLCGKYGPFSPLIIYKVPIFVAETLNRANSCRVRLPQYYEEEVLLDIQKFEEEHDEFFPINPYFFENRRIIEICYNVDDSTRLKSLINNIKHLRYKKINEGIKMIDARAINLNGTTMWEVNEVKHLILEVMRKARIIEGYAKNKD